MPFGGDPDATPCTLDNAIRKFMYQENRYTRSAIFSRAVRDNLRFFTIDEYRNEIGEEQFQLEMVPSVASADMVHPDGELTVPPRVGDALYISDWQRGIRVTSAPFVPCAPPLGQ